jgi:hypothetical protein
VGAIALITTAAAVSYDIAKKAQGELAPKDPAVPGMANYYNMNWGARRRAWKKYESEHPEEMTYEQRIAANQTEIPQAIQVPQIPQIMGEGIGEAVAKDDIPKTLQNEMKAVPRLPEIKPAVSLEGNAVLENHLYLHDERSEFVSLLKSNTMPLQVDTGQAQKARGLAQ